jgi:hypothetical protein
MHGGAVCCTKKTGLPFRAMILHAVFFLLLAVVTAAVAGVGFCLDPLSAVATEEALEVGMASLEAAAVFCLLLARGRRGATSLSRRHFVLAVVVVSINRGCFPSFVSSRGKIST